LLHDFTDDTGRSLFQAGIGPANIYGRGDKPGSLRERPEIAYDETSAVLLSVVSRRRVSSQGARLRASEKNLLLVCYSSSFEFQHILSSEQSLSTRRLQEDAQPTLIRRGQHCGRHHIEDAGRIASGEKIQLFLFVIH
jgi:hypothetical protein